MRRANAVTVLPTLDLYGITYDRFFHSVIPLTLEACL